MALHKSLPAGRLGLLVTAFFGTLLFRELSKRRLSLIAIWTAAAGLFLIFAISFWIRFDMYPPTTAGVPASPRPSAVCVFASWMCAYLVFLLVFFLRSRAFPRVLIWLGQISYPLYLFHGLILAVAPGHLSWPVLLILVLVTSLPLAHVVHILIEKPVGRFQHKLLPHKAVVLGGMRERSHLRSPCLRSLGIPLTWNDTMCPESARPLVDYSVIAVLDYVKVHQPTYIPISRKRAGKKEIAPHSMQNKLQAFRPSLTFRSKATARINAPAQKVR